MTKPEMFLMFTAVIAVMAIMAGALIYIRARRQGVTLHSFFPNDEPARANPVSAAEAEILRHRFAAAAAALAGTALLITVLRSLRRRRAPPLPVAAPPQWYPPWPPQPQDWPPQRSRNF